MILNDLGDYLQESGIGTINDNIYIGELPFDKNNCVGLTYSVSPEPNKAIPYYVQVVDIWARYSEYDVGFLKLQQIFDLIHQAENYEMGRFHVYLSYAGGMIDDLDRDPERRHLFRLTLGFVYRRNELFS